jgi:hypothetical protein
VSLLECVYRLLHRTYRMRAQVEVARFVIGDLGYRRLYGTAGRAEGPAARAGYGARTLVRETEDGLRVSVYYPDALIRALEAEPPQRGLTEGNAAPFAVLVEELDHLLCLADGAVKGQPLSLFELELHADVSKYLVLARFLGAARGRLTPPERVWLRDQLFETSGFCDEDPAVRTRYRDAARWAVRLLDGLERVEPRARIELLREFHDRTATGKLGLIARLGT